MMIHNVRSGIAVKLGVKYAEFCKITGRVPCRDWPENSLVEIGIPDVFGSTKKSLEFEVGIFDDDFGKLR